MMDVIADPAYERITYKTASRVGKTEIINNTIGYFIDVDPCPILVVHPGLDDGRKWSKDQLDPMVRDTEVLQGKVAETKGRNKQSTILHKTFPGGYLAVVGANAPSGLKRSTIRILLLDEVDAYPPSAGIEGDPIKLAEKRTGTVWNRKIIANSTPTIEEISRIETLWDVSDKRFYYVPCPHCKHFQILIFGPRSKYANLAKGMLKWDDANLTWWYYECENCHQPIREAQKDQMVRKGSWQITRPDVKNHAGFHINELYSPFSSWERIIREWKESHKQRETLKVWINTTLGEAFTERENYRLEPSGFIERRESYEKIPEGVIILTAGGDIQLDRIEIFVEGWGLREENWFIDRFIAHGSPAKESTWEAVENYLFKTVWVHEDGFKARYGQVGGLVAAGFDTGGHHTRNVYEFCRRHKGDRIFALKGFGGFGRQFVKLSRTRKVPVPFFPVGVDTGKTLIYERLLIKNTDEQGKTIFPCPGFQHFNMKCDEIYFAQLTSEQRNVKRVRGFPTIVWELPSGRTNEALDGKNYNLATFTIMRPDLAALAESLKERKKTRQADPTEQELPEEQKKPVQKIRRPGSNWINRFRR